MEAMILKAHVVFAIGALIVYLIRGAMMFRGNASSRSMLKLTSAVTLLLFASGVYLGFTLHLSFAAGYVSTKILGLLFFVGFGIIALKPGLSKRTAVILWVSGLLVFIYTYLIATHKIAPLFA